MQNFCEINLACDIGEKKIILIDRRDSFIELINMEGSLSGGLIRLSRETKSRKYNSDNVWSLCSVL